MVRGVFTFPVLFTITSSSYWAIPENFFTIIKCGKKRKEIKLESLNALLGYSVPLWCTTLLLVFHRWSNRTFVLIIK
jgi:hypothetical protein